MMSEIEFDKYHSLGVGYHWEQSSNSVRRMNAYLKARYLVVLECIDELMPNRDHKILDVGCGDGALTGQIYRKFRCHVFGVDPVQLAIDFATSKFASLGYRGDFKVINGYSYAFSDDTFDIVICADVVEHVLEPLTMLNEIRRVLKPGGHLIITTPVRLTKVPSDEFHVQEWYVEDFIELCSSVFGEPEEVKLTHPLFWYELYGINLRYLKRPARYFINLLARLGTNVFFNNSAKHGVWRFYTLQTLVLEK